MIIGSAFSSDRLITESEKLGRDGENEKREGEENSEVDEEFVSDFDELLGEQHISLKAIRRAIERWMDRLHAHVIRYNFF